MTPTPYSDINHLLQNLLSYLQSYFYSKLIGVYLYGSLAWGDFNYRTSDLDVFVVLDQDIEENDFKQLNSIHQKLIRKHPQWYDRIEIAYVSLNSLKRFKDKNFNIALISPGESFNIKEAGTDWLINFYLLQNNSIVLAGPNPRTIITSISRNEFISSVKQQAIEWKDWIVKTKDSIGYQYYAVLTLCRAYYVVRNGEQVSKQRAGAWVKTEFNKWATLIDSALFYHQLPLENVPADIYKTVYTFTQEIVKAIENNATRNVEISS